MFAIENTHYPPKGGLLEMARRERSQKQTKTFKGKYEPNLVFLMAWEGGSN